MADFFIDHEGIRFDQINFDELITSDKIGVRLFTGPVGTGPEGALVQVNDDRRVIPMQVVKNALSQKGLFGEAVQGVLAEHVYEAERRCSCGVMKPPHGKKTTIFEWFTGHLADVIAEVAHKHFAETLREEIEKNNVKEDEDATDHHPTQGQGWKELTGVRQVFFHPSGQQPATGVVINGEIFDFLDIEGFIRVEKDAQGNIQFFNAKTGTEITAADAQWIADAYSSWQEYYKASVRPKAKPVNPQKWITHSDQNFFDSGDFISSEIRANLYFDKDGRITRLK